MGNGRAQAYRADVDHGAWDGPAAMSGCASADDPAAAYAAICAGQKTGDKSKQSSWALPHHMKPGDPPNASGTANALSRLPQTQGLTNAGAAKSHLEAHMKVINPGYAASAAPGPAAIRAARRDALTGNRRGLSGPATRLEPFRAQWRSAPAPQMRDGVLLTRLDGYASVTGIEYEMYDMFGPYGETVHPDAFNDTLAASPDVAFLCNHRGLTMARSIAREGRNATLALDSDPRGLHCEAWVNQERTDVRDLLLAMSDGDITEMSFGFWITEGSWSEDWDHFTIESVDINRGDVSAVNFGANPYTEVAARSRTILADLEHLPAGAQRAAIGRLRAALHPGLRGGAESLDDDMTALISGLDATLDQAIALVDGVPTDGLPDPVTQAIALLSSADEISDELMDKAGIPDPDEDAGAAASAPPAPAAASATPAGEVAAQLDRLTRSTTGRSVEYYDALLSMEVYKEQVGPYAD